MAQLNDTQINGDLNVSGNIQIGDTDMVGEIDTIKNKLLTNRKLIGGYENQGMHGVTGYITTSGKDAHLFIPMNWGIEVSSVRVTSLTCGMRTVAGGYLGGSNQIDLTSYIVSATPRLSQGLLHILLTKSDGWGITNNTPMCGVCTVSYIVS